MHLDRTSLRVALAIVGVALVAHAVYLSMQFVLRVAPSGGLLTVLLLAGLVGTVGAVPAALPAGFALAFPEDRDAEAVIAAFAVAAVVYAVGLAAVAAAVGLGLRPRSLRTVVWLALLYGSTASLGALGGDVVGPLFRPPEGEDGQHPRW